MRSSGDGQKTVASNSPPAGEKVTVLAESARRQTEPHTTCHLPFLLIANRKKPLGHWSEGDQRRMNVGEFDVLHHTRREYIIPAKIMLSAMWEKWTEAATDRASRQKMTDE